MRGNQASGSGLSEKSAHRVCWFPAWDYADPWSPQPNGSFIHAGPFDASGNPNGSQNCVSDRKKPGAVFTYYVKFKRITDGLSKTLFVGEKHIHQNGLGRGDYGDGSVYNADEGYCFVPYAGPGRALAASPLELKGIWELHQLWQLSSRNV